MIKALLSGSALVASIVLTTAYGPDQRPYCTNRFIDRPDCPGAPRGCGLETGREYCPGRRLSDKDRVDLMSLALEQRPPWNSEWGVPRY